MTAARRLTAAVMLSAVVTGSSDGGLRDNQVLFWAEVKVSQESLSKKEESKVSNEQQVPLKQEERRKSFLPCDRSGKSIGII